MIRRKSCRSCGLLIGMPSKIPLGYVHEALVSFEVARTEIGAGGGYLDHTRDAAIYAMHAARLLLAESMRLCVGCLDKKIASEAGSALALCAGRRVA